MLRLRQAPIFSIFDMEWCKKARKRNGGIDSFIAFMVVLIFLMAFVNYSIDISGDMVQSEKIVDVMRKYILIMEGNGCLTSSEQQALTFELEKIGVSNITYLTDPKEKSPYGSEVVLSIQATVPAFQVTGMDGFKLMKTDEGYLFQKTIKSTAQY